MAARAASVRRSGLQAPRDVGLTRPWNELSVAEQLALQPPEVQARVLEGLTDEEMHQLLYDWFFWARPKQLPPPGMWLTWILRAGRGFGKTRTGAMWVHSRALEQERWIALVARTPADARDYMVEGPGGLLDKRGLNVRPDERPVFESSKRRITWPNGSWATIYSDEEPDQLRGFSGDTAWLDELGKYKHPQAVWDNLAFGMREASADQPRKLVTTTPRPLQLLKTIEADPDTATVIGSSYENRANLDPTWFNKTIAAYEGTQLGRQEIHAEILDPEEAGIVRRSSFKLWPAKRPLPVFQFVILSLDTAFTEKTIDKDTYEPDPTACGVYGLFELPPPAGVLPGTIGYRPRLGIMVLDAWNDFLSFPDLLARAKKEMKVAYGAVDVPLIRPVIGAPVITGQGRKPDLLLIEDKGSGRSLIQTMAREGVVAYAYNPGNLSKLQRLHLISHVVQQGHVWLVESETRAGHPKTWYEPLLAQVCSFLGEGSIEHDDHVDQFTQALRVMLEKELISVTEPEQDADPHALVQAPVRDARSPFGRPKIQNVYAQ